MASKGLEALGKIVGTQSLTMYEQNECLKIIEQELKEGEENKQMLNIFKNALSYEVKSNIPFAEDFTKDSIDCFIKTIAEIKTHELDDELKKVLREWVLKNAFPKELKALAIIKKEFLNRSDYKFRFEETNDVYLVIEEWDCGIKVNEMRIPFDRNYIDLLREVLKNESNND